MRILIAEDDFVSRKILYKYLSAYGECDMTTDGIETVEAFVLANESGKPYDLISLDIMMPKIDGLKALETIRNYERKIGIKDSEKCKVIINSALNEDEVSFKLFKTESEAYVTKPFNLEILENAMRKLSLIP